jgi:phosphotransferase family enzyme
MPALPAHPNIEQLRHQAKDLLRAARRGDPAAISRIEAVSGRVTLAAAQLAVARDYGFASWAALNQEVSASGQRPTELWPDAARAIAAEKGWVLRAPAVLGQPRADRCTWLAEGDQGPLIVKLIESTPALERSAWAAMVLRALQERGMPTPGLLWYGPLDERWWLVVQSRLPGEPARVLDRAVLDRLIELIELQADLDVGPGGWDLSWWVGVVVFDGWEGWWEDVERAFP